MSQDPNVYPLVNRQDNQRWQEMAVQAYSGGQSALQYSHESDYPSMAVDTERHVQRQPLLLSYDIQTDIDEILHQAKMQFEEPQEVHKS